MNVNQYLMIQLEILKDVTINEQSVPNVKFEMSLPHGIPWAEAYQICDDFKAHLETMQKVQEEAAAQQKSAAESQAQPEVVDAEVVS